MAASKTSFQQYLEEEVDKVKGVYYPVKAGLLRRAFIKKAPLSKLHPNPNDEFCFPDIGPNYEIISRYEQDYRDIQKSGESIHFARGGVSEPLEVEKTKPDGYMILNGHHRWAAAHRVGLERIAIHIVDLTQISDIRKMLKKTTSDKRVSLDLDEVVFRPEDDPNLEKRLSFPLNRIYKERLRLGIPALFYSLRAKGYDIWIYTSRYYSFEYLSHYFKHYRVEVTGIVTGTARKSPLTSWSVKEMEKLFETRYNSTVHIDNDMVLRTFRGSQEFDEHPLSGSSATWSREVMDIIGEMDKT